MCHPSPLAPQQPPISLPALCATPLPWQPHISPCPVCHHSPLVSPAASHISPFPAHWLTSAYTQFAVPYFIYDIYAMFLCHWHKYRVKGHEGAGPRSLRTVTCAFLHKEFLMVLHHLCMVLVCFPVSVLWRQGKGDFFLGCMLMAELSTPFVCLGKVLILVSTRRGGGEAGRLGSVPGSSPFHEPGAGAHARLTGF
uniref:TLC domain-containing protein n=1 Tax=Gopherus evgoodei TaxID=1825980 RepID=A0A8C4Y5L3_9SAUR